jgi:uncharacterized protein YicC (UPF0701 family)
MIGKEFILPEVQVRTLPGGWIARSLNRDAPVYIISAEIDEEKERIYTHIKPVHKNLKSTIDVYDTKNGDYLYTFELPELVRDIAVRQSKIYAAQDTMISVWKFHMVE